MSGFQFINATIDNPRRDAETQRRIRSQAMRNYRQRQRLEDEDSVATSPERPPSSLSSPQPSPTSQSRQESRRGSSSTQSASVKAEPPTREGSGTADDLPAIVDLDVTTGKRRTTQSPAHDDDSKSNSRRRKRVQRPRAQYGKFGQFTVDLPKLKKPPSVLAVDIDPLSSPGQLARMLSICESYNRWLISDTAVAEEPEQHEMSGPWDNPTSQMLLFALCLKSIGHLEALDLSQIACDKRLFKTRVLVLANKRLRNPAKALEDKTIGALACLTSYEMSRGSPEAGMHLTGLSQIIKLRGGTEKIGHRGGLCLFLEMLDLIHAIYFRTVPIYTSGDHSPPSSNEETPELHPQDPGFPFDQSMLDEIGDFILSVPDLAQEDEPMPRPNLLHFEGSVTSSAFEKDVQQWHQFLTQATPSIAESHGGALAQACGLAAALHLATTSAVAAHPQRLQAQEEELFKIMSVLPDEAWDAFQTLHVRILLTALSYTRAISRRSWYYAHLTRCLYHLDRESWKSTKSLMLRYIDMQIAARQPRTSSVRALANDIEIVVDSSEAREKVMTVQTLPIPPTERPRRDSNES